MAENALKTKINGNYKNLELKDMADGDSIVVKKLYAEVKRTEKTGTKYDENKKWFMCKTDVEYNGEKVSVFMPRAYGNLKYIESTEYADMFDKVGGEGDLVRITAKQGIGKDKKGKAIVTQEWSFAKA